MMAATLPDYEQAGELKIGQVGIANLRVRTLDIAKLVAEMSERVQRAPKLFERAAVVIDFGSLSRCPDAATARDLVRGLQQAGVLPVALAFGTTEVELLAREIGLPLLAKFRAQYERAVEAVPPAPEQAPVERIVDKAAAREEQTETVAAPVAASSGAPGMMHLAPVRSGQQVYAQNRDLTV